jgi:hypothetical protein
MHRTKWSNALLLGAILSSALGASGCAGRQQPQQAPVIMAPQQQAVASASFVIENQSAESICYVNISPSTDTQWGPDQLGEAETLSPGTDRGWTLPLGNYDFRFLDCNQQTMMERRGIALNQTGVTVTFRVRE